MSSLLTKEEIRAAQSTYCPKCKAVRSHGQYETHHGGKRVLNRCLNCGSTLVNYKLSLDRRAAYARRVGKTVDELRENHTKEKVRVLLNKLDEILNSDDWKAVNETDRKNAITRMYKIMHPPSPGIRREW
jgi:hypothetical protein